MTEHSIPLDRLESQFGIQTPEDLIQPDLSPNGQQVNSLPLPRVDVARGVFITSWGTEIQLADRPVSALIVERLQSEGKPKIPMIEVTLMGKHKQLEPHPNHPGYLARLEEWQADAQMALVRYLFTVGTKGAPPQEFIDEQVSFFPNATAQEMKYLWVVSRLPNDDMSALTEAILGQSIPTPKGLEEVADSFRGADQRQPGE